MSAVFSCFLCFFLPCAYNKRTYHVITIVHTKKCEFEVFRFFSRRYSTSSSIISLLINFLRVSFLFVYIYRCAVSMHFATGLSIYLYNCILREHSNKEIKPGDYLGTCVDFAIIRSRLKLGFHYEDSGSYRVHSVRKLP